jgi:outer membrane protein OmpA-like peptidoglycan-associated protein
MPFNSDKYSTGHPSLTIDGSTMYFISDMPGGYGGTDIYVVYKSGNGWGKPINLGYTINTTTDEMFPFIASDGTLYFSSDGLPGLGGLDVFKSTKNGTEWTKPENLHAPINSNNDDFAFTIDAKRNQGYLSSNRSGGKGNDDIYAFVPAKAPQVNCLLKGKITERNTNTPIADATVKLISMSNGMEQSVVTGSDGVYIFDLNPESNYTIYATKKGYFTEVKTLSTIGKNCSSPLEQNLQIDLSISKIPDGPIKIIAGQDDNSGLPLPKINHIYYDFDKADIRPDAQMELDKIVTFMKDNPDMIIELGSHTDSRGKADYNLDLSQRRAASAVAYIVSQGIEQDRISAKGYGESTLVNKCKDGVTCTETEHQQNRRTEFLIRFKK